jgi:hypothetical protein
LETLTLVTNAATREAAKRVLDDVFASTRCRDHTPS